MYICLYIHHEVQYYLMVYIFGNFTKKGIQMRSNFTFFRKKSLITFKSSNVLFYLSESTPTSRKLSIKRKALRGSKRPIFSIYK